MYKIWKWVKSIIKFENERWISVYVQEEIDHLDIWDLGGGG